MHIEQVTLVGFRCFGPVPTAIYLEPTLTTFIGSNGAGKTAAMLGLLRIFGTRQRDRQIRLQDFHVSEEALADPQQLELTIDVVVAFPELKEDGDPSAAPAFFRHMCANAGGDLKCRFRLSATWEQDSSVDGNIVEKRQVITTLDDVFDPDEDAHDFSASDRSQIQFIYIPPTRDGTLAVAEFLKSRLWRAVAWSERLTAAVDSGATVLNDAYKEEPAVRALQTALSKRWKELHTAGTDTEPVLEPLIGDFGGLVDQAQLFFRPSETGATRPVADLSDGQRSLLTIALAATALDIETNILAKSVEPPAFDVERLAAPQLTIVAVEEPENSLAPFFLARIVSQMADIADSDRAQLVLSSHSPSALARVEPSGIRHFRLDGHGSVVNALTLPRDNDDAAKYVREAVRSHPEIYFAKFVVLGEGSSEQIALPLLADARGMQMDRSFVPVIPLGGRHVNHMWALLDDLEIPHATLLDIDIGRFGGGVGRVKTICAELDKYDRGPSSWTGGTDSWDVTVLVRDDLKKWVKQLRLQSVFYSWPLDLDWALLKRFPTAYERSAIGGSGPHDSDATTAVLGKAGDPAHYGSAEDQERMRWYRYLFLGRSKPSTHLYALTDVETAELREATPGAIKALLNHVADHLSSE